MGFEPTVPYNQDNCLAGSPFQPLTHLSIPAIICRRGDSNPYRHTPTSTSSLRVYQFHHPGITFLFTTFIIFIISIIVFFLFCFLFGCFFLFFLCLFLYSRIFLFLFPFFIYCFSLFHITFIKNRS